MGGNTYRVFNTGISLNSNTFNTPAQVCFIRYSYTPIDTLSNVGSYVESNFVGPYGTDYPDLAAYSQIGNIGATATMRPFSTLTFYNFTSSAPVAASNNDQNIINAQFIFGGDAYRSTLILTSSSNAQLFKF